MKINIIIYKENIIFKLNNADYLLYIYPSKILLSLLLKKFIEIKNYDNFI